MSTVNIIIFDGGCTYSMPVNIQLLPQELKEKYEPFSDQTITWNGDKIAEEN